MTGTGTEEVHGDWYATIWADRDYHDLVRARQPAHDGEVEADDVGFPPDLGPREIPLRGPRVLRTRKKERDEFDPQKRHRLRSR